VSKYVCVLLGRGGIFFGVRPVAVINKIKYINLSSEGAPAIDKTIFVNVKPKLISGHETHIGLESRTY
jgi:hypothetical protein